MSLANQPDACGQTSKDGSGCAHYLNLDQVLQFALGWVRDNPKNLGVSVGWAVPLALSLAFPCPK